jgi:regulator of sirC expression with transglutaminase-like and TPR domain
MFQMPGATTPYIDQSSGEMTRQEAERALAELGNVPDDRFPLFEAALLCAIHEDPARDADDARQVMTEATERLRARLKQESPEEALAEALSGDLRLSGDVLTYDDPGNADIITVCERRKGLPVALGVLYLEAARRCELPVQGVDFPGHFLLRIETDEGPLALDPFSEGRVVLPSELIRRALRAGLMPDVADRLDVLMAPVKDRMVVMRLENNIYARASRAGDHARAERSAMRRALLDPADHRPWIDVAAAREGQGALVGAQEALSRAQMLDGGAALAARAARERVRMKLN